MATEMTDGEIVEGVLDATRHLSQNEAAEVLGVSQKTVSAWRAGARPKLQPTRRRDLLEVLEHPTGPADGRDGGEGSDLWSDPFMEVMVREARAAEKRAEAAASWARWLEKEADGRATALREVAAWRGGRETGAEPSPYNPAPERRKGGRQASGQ